MPHIRPLNVLVHNSYKQPSLGATQNIGNIKGVSVMNLPNPVSRGKKLYLIEKGIYSSMNSSSLEIVHYITTYLHLLCIF
jgi:hypothetical protein